jgi:hypothetical protein
MHNFHLDKGEQVPKGMQKDIPFNIVCNRKIMENFFKVSI